MSNPIQPLETFNINDATKIRCFLACPRRYFYEFILNWRREGPKHDLDFGEAWHRAMEYLLIHGYTETEGAYNAFLEYYRERYDEATDMDYAPKNPQYAHLALLTYAQKYTALDSIYEVLNTEISGTVLLTNNHTISFRMDALLRDKVTGLIRFREHKTTKSDRASWYNQWPLSIQLGAYNYVLGCLFPEKEIYGGEVNGSIFTKKEVNHVRVPVRRSVEMMEAWYSDVTYYVESIFKEFSRLFEASTEDNVLKAFPRNPESCSQYFGCPYHDFCLAWANPLRRCDEVPYGFEEYIWNPADREKDAHQIVRV